MISRAYDEFIHGDPARRGGYLNLQAGKVPEIVLDGLSTPDEQGEAQRRCKQELDELLKEEQAREKAKERSSQRSSLSQRSGGPAQPSGGSRPLAAGASAGSRPPAAGRPGGAGSEISARAPALELSLSLSSGKVAAGAAGKAGTAGAAGAAGPAGPTGPAGSAGPPAAGAGRTPRGAEAAAQDGPRAGAKDARDRDARDRDARDRDARDRDARDRDARDRDAKDRDAKDAARRTRKRNLEERTQIMVHVMGAVVAACVIAAGVFMFKLHRDAETRLRRLAEDAPAAAPASLGGTDAVAPTP